MNCEKRQTTREDSRGSGGHKKAGNKIVLNKILKLVEELSEHPFTGTGKPEALKHDLYGCWSRRINQEHRLVYEVVKDTVMVLSVKGHY